MRDTSSRGTRRRGLWAAGIALAVLLALGATAQAGHLFSDVAGHTTLERVITGADPSNGYATLSSHAFNTSYVVRDGVGEGTALIPNAQPGRADRRRSLAYVGQLTDFQLADEESPSRVEFTDQEPTGFAASAWRPQEALQPFIIDWSIRQMNLFAGASPVAQAGGDRAAMDFALITGDQADNMQRNETLWTRALLEGGSLDPNSGSQNPLDWNPLMHPSCAAYTPTPANLAEAAKYTGVQDFDDYNPGLNPYFYDPDDVQGTWAQQGWPSYPGLMDRAQLPFTAAGLSVPSYVTNGNHDGLVQGNQSGNAAFEDIATGCFKALGSTSSPIPGTPPDGLDPSVLLTPSVGMLVPPDPQRRFVDKKQIKQIYGENGMDDAHGYDFVDEDENINSAGGASYYAWDPPEAPGMRFISIDTLSEGGIVDQSSNGNIDDPQFQWLERELEFASGSDKVIVVFGHHPIRSLTSNVPDEAAGPCSGVTHTHGDVPEHDQSPGCDIDPRASTPIHYGEPSQRPSGSSDETLSQLFNRFPHVVAYIAGHTHENRVQPFTRSGGGVWWGIETSATADWPVQHRLVELMDNKDGTLSIFGTILDAAASASAPAPGSAVAFDEAMLASAGREFAYNDPQAGLGSGEGSATDQNVELLVKDPRRADLALNKTDSGDLNAGQTLTYTLTVNNFGPSDASGVTVTDMLPPSVAFGSATSSQGTCSEAAGTVTCDLGDLANGAVATVTIQVTPTVADIITNQASVDGNQADDTPGNNADTEQTHVGNPPPPTDPYPRPKGATPLRASLVPAYDQCTGANRTHGPPLAFASCNPPSQSSGSLTVGTSDANGEAAKSMGSIRFDVIPGNPGTTADEADVGVGLGITDVRRKADLGDYAGNLEGRFVLRLTDRWNDIVSGGGTTPATMVDLTFPLDANCAVTPDPTVGSTCNLATTLDALVPNAAKEGQRAVWEMGQLTVLDGGADGNVNTGPNTVFARQGLFVP